jgi:hypothetical protein
MGSAQLHHFTALLSVDIFGHDTSVEQLYVASESPKIPCTKTIP